MITMESESDKIEGALKEFEGDYDIDELIDAY
jgi:ATP-dependent DNA helicase RecQ